jgi:cell division protein FtsB
MHKMLIFLELIQRRPWLVTVFGGIIMLWLAYSVLFSEHGLPSYLEETHTLRLLNIDLHQVQNEREALAKRIVLLRDDRNYLESVVRRELGYVYPDEYVLILTPATKNQQPPTPTTPSKD